jgi:hypothetical protein
LGGINPGLLNPPPPPPPASMATGGKDFATCQPDLTALCALAQHAARSPVTIPGGYRY